MTTANDRNHLHRGLARKNPHGIRIPANALPGFSGVAACACLHTGQRADRQPHIWPNPPSSSHDVGQTAIVDTLLPLVNRHSGLVKRWPG
jgi:hypothetical protein